MCSLFAAYVIPVGPCGRRSGDVPVLGVEHGGHGGPRRQLRVRTAKRRRPRSTRVPRPGYAQDACARYRRRVRDDAAPHDRRRGEPQEQTVG